MGLIVLGMVVCEAFSACALLLLYRRFRRPGGLSGAGEAPKTVRRRVGKIALPIGATALIGNLMGAANSVLIPQRLVAGGAEVGEAMAAFGVLCGMTLPMLLLPTAFLGALSLLLAPRMAEHRALGRSQAIRDDLGAAMGATSALCMPAMALLTVVGPTVGAALFREPAVGEFMAPLALAVLLDCGRTVFAASLKGMGRQPVTARISLLCGAVQVGFTYGTVKAMGLRGYVLGVVVSDALGLLLTALAFRRETGAKLQLYQWVAAPGLSALLMGLVANLLFHVLQDYALSALQAAALCVSFGAALYLAAMAAQGQIPAQKQGRKT